MKLNGRIGLTALAIVAAASAFGQRDPNQDNYLGVEVGYYFPIDSKIRDAFGASIPKLGFSYGNVGRQADKWRLTGTFNFISANKDGNHFFLVPVTAAIGRVFGQPGDSTRPFVRAGVGVAYMDYGVDVSSTDRRSGHKILPTAAVEAGVILSDRLRLAGSYNWFSKTEGLDFTGFQVTLSYNVLRF